MLFKAYKHIASTELKFFFFSLLKWLILINGGVSDKVSFLPLLS